MDDVLADLYPLEEIAARFHKHPRTLDRWTKLPKNPLPFISMPKGKLLHLPTTREWVLGRMHRANPERQRRPRSARKR